MHLGRRAKEAPDPARQAFYSRLLEALKRPEVRVGHWRLLECRRAWDGNLTSTQFLGFAWESGSQRIVVAVNYGPAKAQCYVEMPFSDLGGCRWRFSDLLGTARYERDGDEVSRRGLYLDLPAWGYHVFEVAKA
jgi:hypothetical protein